MSELLISPSKKFLSHQNFDGSVVNVNFLKIAWFYSATCHLRKIGGKIQVFTNFLYGDRNNPVELLNQIKNGLIFFQNLKNISMMKSLNHSLYTGSTTRNWDKVKTRLDQMFWQMLSGFLSSGNLCLTNGLKLFWPHATSTASIRKGAIY